MVEYRSVVVDYSPKAKKMANALEAKANEMAQRGYELVSVTITNSARAIMMFKFEYEEVEDSDEAAG